MQPRRGSGTSNLTRHPSITAVVSQPTPNMKPDSGCLCSVVAMLVLDALLSSPSLRDVMTRCGGRGRRRPIFPNKQPHRRIDKRSGAPAVHYRRALADVCHTSHDVLHAGSLPSRGTRPGGPERAGETGAHGMRGCLMTLHSLALHWTQLTAGRVPLQKHHHLARSLASSIQALPVCVASLDYLRTYSSPQPTNSSHGLVLLGERALARRGCARPRKMKGPLLISCCRVGDATGHSLGSLTDGANEGRCRGLPTGVRQACICSTWKFAHGGC